MIYLEPRSRIARPRTRGSILSRNKRIYFFSSKNKTLNIRKRFKNLNLSFHKENEIFEILSSIKNNNFCIDAQTCSVFYEELINSQFNIIISDVPVELYSFCCCSSCSFCSCSGIVAPSWFCV